MESDRTIHQQQMIALCVTTFEGELETIRSAVVVEQVDVDPQRAQKFRGVGRIRRPHSAKVIGADVPVIDMRITTSPTPTVWLVPS